MDGEQTCPDKQIITSFHVSPPELPSKIVVDNQLHIFLVYAALLLLKLSIILTVVSFTYLWYVIHFLHAYATKEMLSNDSIIKTIVEILYAS